MLPARARPPHTAPTPHAPRRRLSSHSLTLHHRAASAAVACLPGGSTLRAEKLTIDKAAKDKKCKVYPKDFAIEFTFQDPGPPAVAQPGGGGPGAGAEASADPKIITHVTNL